MDDSKLEKLRKILAKAERASTPEESDTFYAKAQELMVRWSIDASMLAAGRKKDAKITTKVIVFNKSKLWKSLTMLLNCVAIPNDVKAVLFDPKSAGRKPEVTLVGFEDDVENVEMLFASMMLQNSQARNRACPPGIKKNESLRGPWFRSFIQAYAVRIQQRLEERKRMATESATADYGAGSLLPVLASKKAQVEAELARRYGRLKSTKASRERYSTEGAAAGITAADNANIGNTGLAGKKALN